MDSTYMIYFCLFWLAGLAASRKQPVRAARLWGAAEGMEEAYDVHLSPMALSLINYEGRLSMARSQLDEEAWSAAWAQGKAMPLERVVGYALSEEEEEHEPPPTLVAVPEQHSPPAADQRAGRLTAREREVALLVGRGLTNRQIAKELSISERTVSTHLSKILKKLELNSRAQLAAWITEQRLRQ